MTKLNYESPDNFEALLAAANAVHQKVDDLRAAVTSAEALGLTVGMRVWTAGVLLGPRLGVSVALPEHVIQPHLDPALVKAWPSIGRTGGLFAPGAVPY